MHRTTKRTIVILMTVLHAALIAAGCGGSKKDETSNAADVNASGGTADLSGAPKWVTGPCEKFFKSDSPKLCGMGTVQGMTNFSLARSAAQARGRTEIAQKLEVRIRSVLTDYQSQSTTTSTDVSGAAASSSEDRGDTQNSASNSNSTTSVSEQQIEQTTKQITEMTLNGSALVESWTSPNGSFFALMVLDSAEFAATVQNMSTVSAPLKQVVLDNIPKLFSDYDE